MIIQDLKKDRAKEMNKESFNEFKEKCWKKMEYGRKKYGDSFNDRDIRQEIEEDLIDVANYIYMLSLKVKRWKIG